MMGCGVPLVILLMVKNPVKGCIKLYANNGIQMDQVFQFEINSNSKMEGSGG